MPKKLKWYQPTAWLLVLTVGLLRLLVLLPYRLQMKMGRLVGRLMMRILPYRRTIMDINLKLCFPESTVFYRKQLIKESFESVGMGFMEGLMAWFMSPKRFNKIPLVIHGLENFTTPLAEGHGVLACGAHFTCLELMGRVFAERVPVNYVYKRSKNSFMENLVEGRRALYMQQPLSHLDLKPIIRKLKQKQLVWYAPDQDFGPERSVFVDFMGVPTATLRATSLLCKVSGCKMVPLFFNRLPNDAGYEATLLPPLENYPSNDEADALIYNQLLEKHIRKFPGQYLWAHRRFKSRPEGSPSVYPKK
ncbi:MAG: LPS biosynthesis protein [Gammaproteobacteria bacterium]|nr:LPS biosynthesis protein [Gammaproteobacteria bacterium]